MYSTREQRAGATDLPDGGVADRFRAAADELFVCAYRAAFKILGDQGLSEDAAQEALIRAMTRWEKIESYAPAWTTRVAANLAIDEWRRHRADPDDTIDVATDDFSDSVHVRDELNRALAGLTPRRREAIVLRFLCDLSPDDAARAMKTSVAAVLKHTVRGLADLRHVMGALPVERPIEGPASNDRRDPAHQDVAMPVFVAVELVSA